MLLEWKDLWHFELQRKMSPSSEVFQVFYCCHKKSNIGMSSGSLKMSNWGFQQVPFPQLQETKIDSAPPLLLWSHSTWGSSPFVLRHLCQRICLVYHKAKLSALISRTVRAHSENFERVSDVSLPTCKDCHLLPSKKKAVYLSLRFFLSQENSWWFPGHFFQDFHTSDL